MFILYHGAYRVAKRKPKVFQFGRGFCLVGFHKTETELFGVGFSAHKRVIKPKPENRLGFYRSFFFPLSSTPKHLPVHTCEETSLCMDRWYRSRWTET